MEAIILAGGFGTRLRPLTYTRAKSLLPILNKPMISYIIEALPREVDKVVLAVNYKKDQIEEYFKEKDFGKDVIVNDEKTPLGTGGAVKFAEKHITERFFVLNSDIMCSLNLKDMIKFHIKKNAVSTISLWPVENVSEFGVADVKDDGSIVRFVEKPKPEEAPSNFINAGVYLLEPEVLDYIETGRLVSMEKEIFPQIICDTGRFFGFKFKGYWMDIGRISSYIEVHRFLMKKKKMKNYHGEGCDIRGVLKDSCLGDNVYIGDNTRLESTIVYDNARVGKNVFLQNCVVGENSTVGDFSSLRNSVVGDNEKIKDRSNIEGLFVWTKPVPAGYPDKQIGNVIEK
ncbi:MAG: NDP-sugar synthase [Candidatus Thermoplasmatota archaeon]|nr:NDP-sugar synthase [Candidatus Thermoplasmatota archaeon]